MNPINFFKFQPLNYLTLKKFKADHYELSSLLSKFPFDIKMLQDLYLSEKTPKLEYYFSLILLYSFAKFVSRSTRSLEGIELLLEAISKCHCEQTSELLTAAFFGLLTLSMKNNTVSRFEDIFPIISHVYLEKNLPKYASDFLLDYLDVMLTESPSDIQQNAATFGNLLINLANTFPDFFSPSNIQKLVFLLFSFFQSYDIVSLRLFASLSSFLDDATTERIVNELPMFVFHHATHFNSKFQVDTITNEPDIQENQLILIFHDSGFPSFDCTKPVVQISPSDFSILVHHDLFEILVCVDKCLKNDFFLNLFVNSFFSLLQNSPCTLR